MPDMRSILKALMDSRGHTGHSLEDLCGVPSATTYRFLKGKHGEPKATTIRKWAKLYGLTETQLRGYEPIQGVLIPVDGEEKAPTAFTHLTKEEKAVLKILHHIRKEAKHAWLKIGLQLSTEQNEMTDGKDAGDWHGTERRRMEDRRQTGGSNSYRPTVEQRGLSRGKQTA